MDTEEAKKFLGSPQFVEKMNDLHLQREFNAVTEAEMRARLLIKEY